MALFELAAILFALGAVVARLAGSRAAPWLLAAAAAALGLALFADPARWQLVPALLAVGLLALTQVRPRRFGGKSTLAAGGLLVVSAALTQAFALATLPAPAGPYAVGTADLTLVRQAPEGDRRLFVKLWYPARAGGGDTEGLWNELPRMSDIPAPARWSLAYLSHLPTHARPRAAYAGGAALRVVLYNHSFVSWATENSLLAEDLASRGFTVVAVRHMDQFDEYEALDRDGAGPRAVVAEASIIMSRRVADSRFVADRFDAVLRTVPHAPSRVPSGYAAMGFSLGGAIATDLCTGDARCRAVVNLDGAIPGVDYPHLQVPRYLMILGAGHDAVPRSHGRYQRLTFGRAAHLDFHDSAIAVPVTRWVFGRSVGELAREHRRMARTIADFLAGADL